MHVHAYGLGTIEPRRYASGVRYRARVPDGAGGYKDLDTFDTREDAQRALVAAAERRTAGELATHGDTLHDLTEAFFEHREMVKRLRNVKTDRGRWDRHVLGARFADWPITNVAPLHVAEWIDQLKQTPVAGRHAKHPRTLSPQMLHHCVNLLHSFFEWARVRGRIDPHVPNPAAGHDLPPIDQNEGWTYLLPDEQDRLCQAEEIPLHDRLLFAFAMGTGMRQGELYSLELRDVHVSIADEHPHVIVRYGKPNKGKTKSGKIRRVELFGRALDAARAWLAELPRWCKCNPLGLMWPTQRGYRRRDGKPPRGWLEPTRKGAVSYLEAAHFHRPELRHDGRGVRFHDLRHTCGASLISGWWGRSWTLIEVRDHLGHEDIATTQRYAHLAPTVLAQAARETNLPKTSPHGNPSAADSSTISAARHRGFEPLAYGSGGPHEVAQIREHGSLSGRFGGGIDHTALCRAALEAAAAGAPAAGRLLTEACVATRDRAIQIADACQAALDAVEAGDPFAGRLLIDACASGLGDELANEARRAG